MHHLIAAAHTSISPQDARYMGYGLLILVALFILNSVFGKSKNNG